MSKQLLRGNFCALCALVCLFIPLTGPICQGAPFQTGSERHLKVTNQSDQSANRLTVASVLELIRAGVAEDIIVTKIRRDGRAFDLSADQILELKKAGASDDLIRIMMNPSARLSSNDSVATTRSKPDGAKEQGPRNASDPIGVETSENAGKGVEKMIINGEIGAIRSFIIKDLTRDGYTLQKDDHDELTFEKKVGGKQGLFVGISEVLSPVKYKKNYAAFNSLIFVITKESPSGYLILGSMARRWHSDTPTTLNNKKAHQLVRKYLEEVKGQVQSR